MNARALNSAYLAWLNLKGKPFRSGCLLFIVALFAFALFAGSMLNQSLRLGMESLAGRLGADIMIVPHGYEKDMQVALLRGEPSSFYLKAELAGKIRNVPGVQAVSPQLFLASLDAGCCTAKVQLIGYDPASDFVIAPWMRQALGRPLDDNQVVAGSRIINNGRVDFFAREFSVAARLDRTGMGFDTSVFMTMTAAQNLLLHSGILRGDTQAITDYASSLMIKVAPGFEPRDVANNILQRYAIDYNLDFVVTKSLLSDLGGQLGNIAWFIYALSAFLWVMAVLVLFIVFSSSINERKRELSLLRVLGASRKKLVKLIMLEAIYISIGGAALGVLAASVLVFAFAGYIFNCLGLPYLQVSWLGVAATMALTVIVAAMVGPLASIYSALSISRVDSYLTMREGE